MGSIPTQRTKGIFMNYNFDLAVSATISSKVAEDMVRRIVEDQTGKKVSSVEVRLRKVTKGVGTSELTETVFDGYHVYFQNEPVKKPSDSRFKPAVYD